MQIRYVVLSSISTLTSLILPSTQTTEGTKHQASRMHRAKEQRMERQRVAVVEGQRPESDLAQNTMTEIADGQGAI